MLTIIHQKEEPELINVWQFQTHLMLDEINRFPKESKIILILRHSQRKNPESKKEIPKLGLTAQGSIMARKFGESLPKDRQIRLSYSPLRRCCATAKLILDGFKSNSAIGVLKGPLKTLSGPGASLDFYCDESVKYKGEQFILRWAAGLYSEEIISPFIPYCRNMAETILENMNDAPSKCIEIYVTHDIFLMSLRFGWFGFPPNEKWVSFLGGMAFVLKENCILLFDIDQLNYVDIPYWWKTKNHERT